MTSTNLSKMLAGLKSDTPSTPYMSSVVLDSHLSDINHFVEKCKRYKDQKTLEQSLTALNELSEYIKSYIKKEE